MKVINKQARENIWTKSFVSLALTQFLLFSVFYALLTTLPIYVIVHLGESESKAGLVVTFMLLSAITIRPFSAKIIDLFGKKSVLVASVLAFLLTTIAYLFTNHFITLSLVRFIHGISFGTLTTVTGAIAADIVPPARRGEGMGYFSMAMNIAVVVGPFVGLLLIQRTSFLHLFIALSIMMVLSLIFSFFVKVDEVLEEETALTTLKLSDLVEVKALPAAIISGLVGFSYGSILSFVPVFAEMKGLANVSSYFFLIFAVVMIVFRPYLGRAFDEKGARVVLVPSLTVFALGLILLSVTNTATIFLLAAAIIGLGYGSVLPGFQTLAVQHSGHKRTSQAMSTFFTLYDLGIALGAFTWGLISFQYGFQVMYIVSSIVVICTMFIFNYYIVKRS